MSTQIPEDEADVVKKRKRKLDPSTPYKCSECNKYFTTNSNLRVHFRTHTGEKAFACQLCDKTFAHKCNLVEHSKRVQ